MPQTPHVDEDSRNQANGDNDEVRPILLCLSDAAHLLGISPRLLQRLTAEHLIPSVKLGRRRLYRLESITRCAAVLENYE